MREWKPCENAHALKDIAHNQCDGCENQQDTLAYHDVRNLAVARFDNQPVHFASVLSIRSQYLCARRYCMMLSLPKKQSPAAVQWQKVSKLSTRFESDARASYLLAQSFT
jgi:hypothetical protein